MDSFIKSLPNKPTKPSCFSREPSDKYAKVSRVVLEPFTDRFYQLDGHYDSRDDTSAGVHAYNIPVFERRQVRKDR